MKQNEWDADAVINTIFEDSELAVKFISPSTMELLKINNPLLFGIDALIPFPDDSNEEMSI